MKRFLAFAAAACCAIGATSADAADLKINEHLRPLAFLAGSCWHGPLPDGKLTDSHCFKWFQGGQYLRDRNEMIGSDPPYGGETTYYWDHDAKRVAFIAWTNDGGISTGHMTVEDGVLTFPDERYVGQEGEMRLQSELRQTGPDKFHIVKSEIAGKDGALTPVVDATYLRKPLNW